MIFAYFFLTHYLCIINQNKFEDHYNYAKMWYFIIRAIPRLVA